MGRGLTLVEILVTVAILAILATLTVPLILDFYKDQQINSSTQEVVQTLRRAQLKAMSVESDSSFGVYLTNDNYILFRGDTYNPGDPYNEIFNFPQIITVSGLSEVVFTKFEGLTEDIGSIVLSIDNESRIIEINNFGKISLASVAPTQPPYLAQIHYRWRNDDGGE